ncbi:hypothetical protein CHARACLAT_032501 [Characodon lateralis]|uniref:Uncharacterized protein n=1 Tax=Characodon lateralis TaxID=208331 RepID=A0ABU7DLR0_9TELE|nr:hypothetical protein [Characodon lateralis]
MCFFSMKRGVSWELMGGWLMLNTGHSWKRIYYAKNKDPGGDSTTLNTQPELQWKGLIKAHHVVRCLGQSSGINLINNWWNNLNIAVQRLSSSNLTERFFAKTNKQFIAPEC